MEMKMIEFEIENLPIQKNTFLFNLQGLNAINLYLNQKIIIYDKNHKINYVGEYKGNNTVYITEKKYK